MIFYQWIGEKISPSFQDFCIYYMIKLYGKLKKWKRHLEKSEHLILNTLKHVWWYHPATPFSKTPGALN